VFIGDALDSTVAATDGSCWRMRQDRRAQPLGSAGVGARQVARFQVQVGGAIPQSDGRFGLHKRRQAVSLGGRHRSNIQPHTSTSLDLVMDLVGELRRARQFQTAGLMKR